MKQEYEDCVIYRNHLNKAEESKENVLYINQYNDPGVDIDYYRQQRQKYLGPCDIASWYQEPVPCDDCPFAGSFLTAPKMTPYLHLTRKWAGTFFAETCKRFGFGTNEVITFGQVWSLSDDYRRETQGAAIIAAAVDAVGARNVLIITNEDKIDMWRCEIERFAELFGKVTFARTGEIADKTYADKIRIIFSTVEALPSETEQLCGETWDLMIVDCAHDLLPEDRDDYAYRVSEHATYRLVITDASRDYFDGDWFWIFRLADPRIFGTDYDAFRDKYLGKKAYVSNEEDAYFCRFRSICIFANKIYEPTDEPFYGDSRGAPQNENEL